MNPFAARLVSDTDWSELRTLTGPAFDVPAALGALAAADSESDATQAYWRLDNHVVVQGQLFPAAIAVIPVLLSMITGHLSHWARIRTFDLLLQIAGGATDMSELSIGRDLAREAREASADGVWMFYGYALDADGRLAETALELAAAVDHDILRRKRFLSALVEYPAPVGTFAQELLNDG